MELVTLEEAARVVNKTVHNIRDYIQRGRIAYAYPNVKTPKRQKLSRTRIKLGSGLPLESDRLVLQPQVMGHEGQHGVDSDSASPVPDGAVARATRR